MHFDLHRSSNFVRMRCVLLIFLTIFNFGTLKTESLDYLDKDSRAVSLFPLSNRKIKDLASDFENGQVENENEQRAWNSNELIFRPNNRIYEKTLNIHDINEYPDNQDVGFMEDQFKSINQLDDVQSRRLEKYLVKALQRPESFEFPLIFVDNTRINSENSRFPLQLDNLQGVTKRARLYMEYPWKRHNSRTFTKMDYDPYNTCNPTKHDVFQLLSALHDAQNGKTSFVNFCNRRRPASAIYTNIRFLGRKRK